MCINCVYIYVCCTIFLFLELYTCTSIHASVIDNHFVQYFVACSFGIPNLIVATIYYYIIIVSLVGVSSIRDLPNLFILAKVSLYLIYIPVL